MTQQIDTHPRRQEIMKALRAGDLTVREAAAEFGVEYHVLWKYLKRHEGEPIARDVQSIDEKVQLLNEVLGKVKTNVDRLLLAASTGEALRYGPAWIRELRSLVEILARLQRQILESPQVLIQNVIQTQTQLQTFLIQNLCSECKRKVIEYLEVNR